MSHHDDRNDHATPDTDESSTSLDEEVPLLLTTGGGQLNPSAPRSLLRQHDDDEEEMADGELMDLMDPNEPVLILGEVVAGNHLQHPHQQRRQQQQEQEQSEQHNHPSLIQSSPPPRQPTAPAGGSNLALEDEEFRTFCVVKFGPNIIHKTKKSSEAGSNPIWTISDHAIFLLQATPQELAQHDLNISLWFKKKDPLLLTTLETCLVGQADVPSSTLLHHCHEQRLEVNLYGQDEPPVLGRNRGTLTLRFRLAAPSDDVILRLFDESLSLFQKSSTRSVPTAPTLDLMQLCQQQQPAFESLSKVSIERILGKPLSPIVTEADETQVAGENFVKSISSAFTSRSYFDRALGETRILVKPYPDPHRIEETTYLTAAQLKKETMGPSKESIRPIGAHSGSYCIYTGLAVAASKLDPNYVPNLSLTSPVMKIGPHPSWSDPKKIGTIDPFGHLITECYGKWLEKGWDIRPTIAVTKAHIDLPECREAMATGRLQPDGKVLLSTGQSVVSKAAIEPVWYLPEVARRFQTTEMNLRQSIFRMTNGMYPELITRPDIKIFLPPIGGLTIYMWGDPDTIPDPDIELTCRVHDECNGSDVFGPDICTCRPYLTHAIEECIRTAQRGGCGLVIYYRKEGRSLGEVTKYLVYNTRKRQEGGDSAERYFSCTEQVAGVQDTRFQALMPDPLHFLGVTKIHNFISMSDMKYNAIVSTGIEIVNRVEIPPEMVPDDAQVEITAKVFHGYNAGKAYQGIDAESVKATKGRDYDYDGKVSEPKTD